MQAALEALQQPRSLDTQGADGDDDGGDIKEQLAVSAGAGVGAAVRLVLCVTRARRLAIHSLAP